MDNNQNYQQNDAGQQYNQQQYNQQQYDAAQNAAQQQYYQQQYEMQRQAQQQNQQQQYNQQQAVQENTYNLPAQGNVPAGNGGNGGKKKTGLIIGIIAAIFVIAAIIVTVIILKNKKSDKDNETTTEATTEEITTEAETTTEATTEETTEATTEETTEATTEEESSTTRYYKLTDMKDDEDPDYDYSSEIKVLGLYYCFGYLALYEDGTGHCDLLDIYIVDDITYDDNSVTVFGVTENTDTTGDVIDVYSSDLGTEFVFEKVSERDYEMMEAYMEGAKASHPAHSNYNIGEKLVENTSFTFEKMNAIIPKDFDVVDTSSTGVTCQLTSNTSGAVITLTVQCLNSEYATSSMDEMAQSYGLEYQSDYTLDNGTVLNYYSTGTRQGYMFNALSENVEDFEASNKDCTTRYYVGFKEADGFIYKIEIVVDDGYFGVATNSEYIGKNILEGIKIE